MGPSATSFTWNVLALCCAVVLLLSIAVPVAVGDAVVPNAVSCFERHGLSPNSESSSGVPDSGRLLEEDGTSGDYDWRGNIPLFEGYAAWAATPTAFFCVLLALSGLFGLLGCLYRKTALLKYAVFVYVVAILTGIVATLSTLIYAVVYLGGEPVLNDFFESNFGTSADKCDPAVYSSASCDCLHDAAHAVMAMGGAGMAFFFLNLFTLVAAIGGCAQAFRDCSATELSALDNGYSSKMLGLSHVSLEDGRDDDPTAAAEGGKPSAVVHSSNI